MNKPLVFNFRFKGDRDYVHGTDLYQTLTGHLFAHGMTALEDIDMTIHQISRTNLAGDLAPSLPEQPLGKVAVAFKFVHQHQPYRIALSENGEPIKERYPYSEDEIGKVCRIDAGAKSIHCGQETQYSNIEALVAMNKLLLKTLFPAAPGKWYFTRLQLRQPVNAPPWKSIELDFLSHFNFKLTKTRIRADGAEAGYVYFSLV